MSSRESTTEAHNEYAAEQDSVLDWYGVDAINQYVDLDKSDMRAHVLKAGSGDPVVLLHGGGDVAMIWAPLLARLQGSFSLYAPDRPGCGLSDGFSYHGIDVRKHACDFVCSLMDELDIDRADIVACSAGGYFALAAALDRPERFRRMVMVGYPLGIGVISPVWRAPSGVRLPLLVGGVPGFGHVFKFMQSRMDADGARDLYEDQFNVDISKYPEEYFEAYARAIQLPGAADSFVSFIDACLGLRGFTEQADLSDDLPGLDVPMLILWGEHDIAPPEDGRECCARIPAASFEVAEGAGHYPFNDVPDWTADRIREYFAND